MQTYKQETIKYIKLKEEASSNEYKNHMPIQHTIIISKNIKFAFIELE